VLRLKVSFPSPARLERGGFGNEAGVRENHYAFTVTNHLFFRTHKVFPALAARRLWRNPIVRKTKRDQHQFFY
jgi:hypothetical protein